MFYFNKDVATGIFSSGVYLRRVAALTLRTKDLVSSVRSSAPTALAVSVWDIFAPLYEVLYLIQGADPTSPLGFSYPILCPTIADNLQ